MKSRCWKIFILSHLGLVAALPLRGDLLEGLQAYWNFNENFTATVGCSTYDGSASATGVSIDAGAGRFDGSAARFNREDEGFVRVNNSPFSQSSYTYSAWYYLDVEEITGANRYFILEATNGSNWPASYGLRISQDSTSDEEVGEVFTHGGDGSKSIDFAAGNHQQWNHIAVTFDASAVSDGNSGSIQFMTFLNGSLVNEDLRIEGSLSPSDFLILGGHRAETGRNWEGWIDEVAVWDRVLSVEEIGALQSGPIVAIPEPFWGPGFLSLAALVFAGYYRWRRGYRP
ncbi:MAG: LamG domain-containing protein [Opitutales bacterium]|nr:LamG domain-containing protein [Opitutales bacterium]